MTIGNESESGGSDDAIDGSDRPPSSYADRIGRLADRAATAAASFEAPDDPPDEERAIELLREGLGPIVSVYIEARTADEQEPFSGRELRELHRGANTYLRLYAACYGADIDPDVAIRTIAELVVDTHDIHDTATLLTGVPER